VKPYTKDEIKKLPEYKKLSRYEKVAFTNRLLYGENFYSKIGKEGGKACDNRPFKNKEFAKKAGVLSGISKRKKIKK
jgi:hypothetical protein